MPSPENEVGNEDSMVFDLCLGWVPLEDLLLPSDDPEGGTS
jgi:hypothetical protein